MLRSEAMAIARGLLPNGFEFNSLELKTDEEGYGQWVATYLDDSDPPRAVVERWTDVYTEADPAPQGEENADTDAESEGEQDTSANGQRVSTPIESAE